MKQTTEQRVRKCFPFCFHETGTTRLCHYCVHWKWIARAARRFVRMESKIKQKKRFKLLKRAIVSVDKNGDAILPKKWGCFERKHEQRT